MTWRQIVAIVLLILTVSACGGKDQIESTASVSNITDGPVLACVLKEGEFCEASDGYYSYRINYNDGDKWSYGVEKLPQENEEWVAVLTQNMTETSEVTLEVKERYEGKRAFSLYLPGESANQYEATLNP